MPDIHGNIEGVRKSTLAELQTLYDFPIERDEYLPIELARLMGRYSCALNREISLYITRDGEIIDITVGDTASVPLCDIRLRRSAQRKDHGGADSQRQELLHHGTCPPE